MATAAEVKQLAVNLLGVEDSVNFTSSTDTVAVKMNSLYENTVKTALQRYRWGFALDYAKLDNAIAVTGERYSYYYDDYEFPDDFLFLRNQYTSPTSNVPLDDFVITVDGLYCNISTAVYIEYTARVDEVYWPTYFIDYIKYRLALDLCFDLTGDTDLMQILANQEALHYINATNIDSRQQKPKRVRSSPFVDIRG
jgi:hypothetical protein